MKEKKIVLKGQEYAAPRTESVEITNQGVLCASSFGMTLSTKDLYTNLFNVAAKGDPDCGGLVSFNYISGEPVTGLMDGRPLFVRSANDKFTLVNFPVTHGIFFIIG